MFKDFFKFIRPNVKKDPEPGVSELIGTWTEEMELEKKRGAMEFNSYPEILNEHCARPRHNTDRTPSLD